MFGEYLNSQFREFVCSHFQKSLADSYAPAEEDNEDVDSEEEDEIPHFVTDELGYPTLPPVGHMNLDKQKVVIRLFVQTIYRGCFLLSFFHNDKALTVSIRQLHIQPCSESALGRHIQRGEQISCRG